MQDSPQRIEVSVLLTAKQQIIQALTKPSERSKQRLVGASQIGGCAYHLGLDMLESKNTEHVPESETGMAAWLGTAMHSHIESTLDLPGAIQEAKVDIFEIPGYGKIGGHVDLYWNKSVLDWKLQGKWKVDKQKLAYRKAPHTIPDTTYRVQLHLYGYGLVQAGYEVETVNLVSFPKLSNNFNDITIYTEKYNPELVQKAIDRALKVWEYCSSGLVEELPRSEDCYDCSSSW